MSRLIRPATLLGRTIQALALAFLLFGLLATALLEFTLVRPNTKQAADDLAAFLVLAAQIWVELPPYTRPDYEREMMDRHHLRILQAEAPYPAQAGVHSYLSYLESALADHLHQAIQIHQHPDYPGWLWADLPMGGRMLRLGFRESRLQNPTVLILPFLAVTGLFIAFALSVMLVRRVTRPLAAMAEATHRIGEGDFSATIPETGPREIADLARKLNLMENQIRELLENRTTLLAGISHDLRTPLARMHLELELLQGAQNGELVDGLRSDIAEMEKLISQTLLLAKGLGGEVEDEVDINALLDGIAADLRKSGGEIVFQPKHGCVRKVKTNALKRVVSNLVENAVVYSDGLPVKLECTCDGEGVEIRVIDQGPGIPASEHQAVFQPFHRLENSRSRATGGSGLGLAIVHQLCRANGWSTQIISPPGGGTVFRVHLPGKGNHLQP
ncbi:MAG: HAMP domain-containing histidine kinase [Chromatiaceae bacterium]|nr:HAMP domain-containing histidine kinase [Chromatiaceae bacterium]